MEERKGSIQISKKTFISSVIILFLLMMVSGILTRVIPQGSFKRVTIEGRIVIDPLSFTFTNKPSLPIYKWFLAPIDVLFSTDGVMIITIILFILIIGGTFSILDKSGIIRYVMAVIVDRYGKQKYYLLCIMTFFFMLFGAVLGIFEEMVALVPIAIALSYSLGWDSLIGLGMSMLAIGFGFSAAIFNPFTIGVAQKLTGLPLFSGALYRVLIFIIVYVILTIFLLTYAKKIENNPEKSLVFEEDKKEKERYLNFLKEDALSELLKNQNMKSAVKVFTLFIILMIFIIIIAPFIKSISNYSLPIVALLFLIGGIVSGYVSGFSGKKLFSTLIYGMAGIAPGIILILMATSVKHIITQGGVMDTILYYASILMSKNSTFLMVLIIYLSVLILNFFIGSGSAKAFLVMPIIAPLADIVGITRQCAVQAFCFGDGFSNMLYPTNAVLLITLGLSVVSYPKWFKWTIKLQLIIFIITVVLLEVAVKIKYGPF